MAANTSMFNIGDIVTVRIPRRYGDSKWLYKRRGLSESERYVISDVLFASYSREDNFIYWEYELKDHADSHNIPEEWITLCDEDIEPIDIKYIIGI